MKNAIIALLFAASCFAQTKKPAVKPQSECSIALKATAQASDSLASQLADARAEVERLKKENQEITKKSAELHDAATQVYNESVQLQQAYKKAVDENFQVTTKYNNLLIEAKMELRRAQDMLASANAQNADRQRFANALALYSLMPKYQPPQTINLNVTDCSKAICVP